MNALKIKNSCCFMLCWFVIAVPMLRGSESGTGKTHACAQCGRKVPSCQVVECTIMVPMTVIETRMKSHVVYVEKELTEKYTVLVRKKKEPRTYYKPYWCLEDKIEELEITEERCLVVMSPVTREQKVQVAVPIGSDDVLHPGDSGKTACQRELAVLQEEVQSCTTLEPKLVFDTTKRKIHYCTKVPREIECGKETVYELVPELRERKVQAWVPELKKHPVTVEVCRMVPKTVLCCQACSPRTGKK
jgi:hypothetical protein